MKVVAFGASNSSKSINKQLASHCASLVSNAEVEVLDLNDFEMPLFSQDKEAEIGKHPLAQKFIDVIAQADVLIISFAEHNGSYTAAYKNIFDWASRVEQKVFQNKSAILLSTSPGPGGAKNVLASAVNSAPHFGMELLGNLSVPSFYDNFDSEQQQLTNEELKNQLQKLVSTIS